MQQQLQHTLPDLFSALRRNINSLRETSTATRKEALDEILKVVTTQQLTSQQFDELTHLALKEILRCFSDNSEYNREHSVMIINELLSRCSSIRVFLPYVFAVLTDRTNCNDLQGIANVPERMRPAPGQKPKVMLKLIQNCQQIRLLFCTLMKRILSLVEEDDIRDKLDEIVNILLALIMDPAPGVQKTACQVLEYFCMTFKLVLLHYTEIMGRAVLLPLVSKKSKIRIAGLNALTAIFWCGLWKYNAFVFQNLVGFRDPNSVPIKDFYEPTNNINYLATFINDPNAKVRQQFMRHLKIWTCDLDDKYDHHGRVVPYMLSGLFDSDDKVRETAVQMIEEIGRQIEIEKEKDLRENKQYAIDAVWTWQGKMVDLPTHPPLKGRPSLGSRVFVRGHVRKFWTALYKEIKDIHQENRTRAGQLMLYGVIYTEQYMSQYLDVMLPHLFSSCVAIQPQDEAVAVLIRRTLHLLGRYCQVSAYEHIVASALKGELVQSEDFLKGVLKGMTELVNGLFEAIPEGAGLCHKTKEINTLLQLLQQCNVCAQIYKANSQQGLDLAFAFLSGLKAKASVQESQQLLQTHLLTLLKLISVSHYQLSFGDLFATNTPTATPWTHMLQQYQLLTSLYPSYFQTIEETMQEIYLDPPSLMDTNWKVTVFIHSLLSQWTNEEEQVIFTLTQEVICSSLENNRSIQMLTFLFRYVGQLFARKGDKKKLTSLNRLVRAAAENLVKFDPVKKVPTYDQHLQKPPTDPSLIRVNQDVYIPLFVGQSQAIQTFYSHKTPIPPQELGPIVHLYLLAFRKFMRDKTLVAQGIKTVWLMLQRANFKQENLSELVFTSKDKQNVVVCEELIDFLVERIQTLHEPDRSQVNMVFDSLKKLVQICPKIDNAAVKLLTFYPNYPSLLQKLFKYALDEKDVETRNKFSQLLAQLCGKLRPWFQLELRLSEEKNRFARANMLKSVLERKR